MLRGAVALAACLAGCGDGPAAGPPDAAPPAPETTIAEGPAAVTRMTRAAFVLQASIADAAFECSLDGAPFAPCAAAPSFDVAEGAHMLAARARAGGAADPSPATLSWRVDVTPPQTTISAGPEASLPQSEATFRFSADEDGATFTCVLDGGAPAACASGVNFARLALGPHSFAVRAADPATNAEDSPASWSWTVTAVTPETAVTGQPFSPWGWLFVDFEFAADVDGARFDCRLDDDPLAACVSPHTYHDLEEGTHVFEVVATDPQGRRDPTAARATFVIDYAYW